MTVAQLQKLLATMPPNAAVGYIWDGTIRSKVELVYLARSGKVALSAFQEFVHDDDSRPVDAPTYAQNRYWKLPGKR